MENAIITAASILGACLAIGMAAIGATLADGAVTTKAIEGITRQPEAKDSIMTTMLISVGLIESIPIIAAVIAIVLIFANPFLK